MVFSCLIHLPQDFQENCHGSVIGLANLIKTEPKINHRVKKIPKGVTTI